MKKFQLYSIHKNHRALITSYEIGYTSNVPSSITYDEQLSQSDNDQYTLTFSMPRYLNFTAAGSQYNYWLDIVKLGTKLRLVIDNGKIIDFIVSAVSPALSRQNIIYNFTAQDEVSYE